LYYLTPYRHGWYLDWIRGGLTLHCSSNVIRKARPRSKSLEDGEEIEGEGNDDENGDVVAQSKGSERNVAGNRRGYCKTWGCYKGFSGFG